MVVSNAPGGQLHDLAALQRGLVGAEADAGPVGGLFGIWERIAILDERADDLVREVRMAAAVAAALDEAQVGLFAFTEFIHTLLW